MFTVTNITVLPEDVLPEDIDSLADTAGDEGHAIVARLAADFRSGENRFDAPGEGLWEARVGTNLVGICGLNRDPFATPAEKAGRVRRLYVIPEFRRQGIASALLENVIAVARLHFSLVNAFTTNPAAIRFYTARGFRTVAGVERRSVELPL